MEYEDLYNGYMKRLYDASLSLNDVTSALVCLEKIEKSKNAIVTWLNVVKFIIIYSKYRIKIDIDHFELWSQELIAQKNSLEEEVAMIDNLIKSCQEHKNVK